MAERVPLMAVGALPWGQRHVAGARRAVEPGRLLSLVEVQREYGLHPDQVYALAQAERLHPLRRPGQRGPGNKARRTYYAEWEVRQALESASDATLAPMGRKPGRFERGGVVVRLPRKWVAPTVIRVA